MSDERPEFEQLANEKQVSLLREFWSFVIENKVWWIVPVLVALGLLALVLILGSSAAAPFIYPLF